MITTPYKLVFLTGLLFVGIYCFSQDKKGEKRGINTEALQGLQKEFSEADKRQANAVQSLLSQGYPQYITTGDEYSELIGADAFGRPQYYLTANVGSGKTIQTVGLNNGASVGQSLTGQGMRIYMWDSGKPRVSHQLLGTNRITYGTDQSQTIQRHATHISGTMIGYYTGSFNGQKSQGIAYESTLQAYDWSNDATEMTTAAEGGSLIANNSYGFNPVYYKNYQFGQYNETAAKWDAIMCAAQSFQIVKSAGNARDDNSAVVPQVSVKGGYDLLEGAGIAKNVLVVGGIKELTSFTPPYNAMNIQTAYSNWGPTDDGRIKPDLVAKGENVFSSIETTNSSYALYDGTSSAAASVTAGITLLQQYWKKVSLNNAYMLSSTVRGLLIHTIDEIDTPGPDYQNGWGVMNADKAAKLIKARGSSVIIKEDMYKGQEIRMIVAVKGDEPLVATLAWTDPAALSSTATTDDDTTKKLVNDLDIRIERLPAGSTTRTFYYPWKLGGMANRAAPATQATSSGTSADDTKTNSADNIEKIEIPVSTLSGGGLYHIVIKHKGTLTPSCLPTGSNGQQPFSLIVSGVSFCENPITLIQNSDNIGVDNTLVQAKTITASNIVRSQAQGVLYHGKDWIELIPQPGNTAVGFEVESGADFLAEIVCGIDNSYAFSNEELQSLITPPAGTPPPTTPISPFSIPEQEKVTVYPNPVVTSFINIDYTLTAPSKVSIDIYTMTGNLVKNEATTSEMPVGTNHKVMDVSHLEPGIYIMRITTNHMQETIKIIRQ